MNKINPEVKELWVNALRYGGYRQCKGRMKKNNNKGNILYCVLGVLCDVFICQQKLKGIKNIDWLFNPIDKNYYFKGEIYYPPKIVLNWLGVKHLDDTDVPFYSNGNLTSLSGLNDNKHKFKELANVIEKYL